MIQCRGKIIILDTSFILEFMRVPQDHDVDYARQALERYKEENKRKTVFYATVPILFEVANHIADVDNGDVREILTNQFMDIVSTSLEDADPWVVPFKENNKHVNDAAYLQLLLSRFSDEFSRQQIGLSDVSVIDIAKILKSKCTNLLTIHIWTRDRKMKPHEPDREINPLPLYPPRGE